MLKSLARLFVVFAVALAVPMQGMAAAAAGICMPLGQHEPAAQQAAGADEGPAHDSAGRHQHGETGGGQNSNDSYCPPCVSCCAAAAIVSFAGVFALEQSCDWATVAMFAPLLAAPPYRLDRPPLAV